MEEFSPMLKKCRVVKIPWDGRAHMTMQFICNKFISIFWQKKLIRHLETSRSYIKIWHIFYHTHSVRKSTNFLGTIQLIRKMFHLS